MPDNNYESVYPPIPGDLQQQNRSEGASGTSADPSGPTVQTVSEYPPNYTDSIPEDHSQVNIGWKTGVMAKPGASVKGSTQTITMPEPQMNHVIVTGYDDSPVNPTIIISKHPPLNSREKSMCTAIAIVTTVAVAFIIAGIFTVLNYRKPEELIFPTKPAVTTLIPPWLTFATTTTTTPTTTTRHPAWNTCLDDKCLAAGNRMKSLMTPDPIKNSPCKNFYQYACGGFNQSYPIPDSLAQWDTQIRSQEEIFREIQKILETYEEDRNDTVPETMAKQVYSTCMNLDNEGDNTDLKVIIEDLTSTGEVAETLAKITLALQQNSVLTTKVDLDEKDSKGPFVLYVDQPEFALPRSYLVEPESSHYVAYEKLIAQTWDLLYPEAPPKGEDVAEKILKIEVALASIATKIADREDKAKLYNTLTVEELQKLDEEPLPVITWQKYFDTLFQGETGLPPSTVVVRDLHFFENVNTVLKGFDHQDVQNFLKWRILFQLGPHASFELERIFTEYRKITEGMFGQQHRWRTCTSLTHDLLGNAIAYRFIQNNMDDLSMKQFMLDYMYGTFKQNLPFQLYSMPGVSDPIHAAIAHKVGNLTLQLGFPEFLSVNVDKSEPEDTNTVLDYYADLALTTETNQLQNILDITEWKSRNHLKALHGNATDTSKWRHDVLRAESFYWTTPNLITIPAGLLRLPFYMYEGEVEYLNYATLGAFAAREMLRGYDLTGLQYGPPGSLDSNWLSEENNEFLGNITKNAECFEKQYNQFAIPAVELNINGRQTLSENIADNGAFSLIRNSYNSRGAKLLPGFDGQGGPGTVFTVDQLFFIAYAQNFCGTVKKETLETQVRQGFRSPNEFVVRGVIANSPDFPRVFGCAEEDTPDPETLCKIW